MNEEDRRPRKPKSSKGERDKWNYQGDNEKENSCLANIENNLSRKEQGTQGKNVPKKSKKQRKYLMCLSVKGAGFTDLYESMWMN